MSESLAYSDEAAPEAANEKVQSAGEEKISHASVEVEEPEKFIPLTKFALLDRITRKENWSDADYPHVNRFFNLLSKWRHQEYCARLTGLTLSYLPFSPDRDTVRILEYSDEERDQLQASLVQSLEELLIQGNYQRLTKEALEKFFSVESPYGLNLKVELEEFEELLIFCRGAGVKEKQVRTWKKLFLGFETHEIPIFQRLFLLIKLKPENERLKEIMTDHELPEKKARKMLMRGRKNLPDEVTSDLIYLKLFKQIPQSDLEMLFPNTRVDFRLLDKIKLGVTAGGGTIAGLAGMTTKLLAAFATFNIFALIGGFVGLIGLIVRQVMKFFNQRTQYMMVLAQNLYFHSLADNRGVLTLMCDRAEEEDIKEEMLLYAYLTQYSVPHHALGQVKQAIESYLMSEFSVKVDYDIFDALSRLQKDGLVVEEDGQLRSLPLPLGVKHLERLWESCLDSQEPGIA